MQKKTAKKLNKKGPEIEKIMHKKELIAMIIRSHFKKEGIIFFTADHFSQQLAYMHRPKGHTIEAHRHILVPRNVLHTQEVIFVKSGQTRIDFYSEKQKYLESKILSKGDIILLATGGHGFKMLKKTEMVEVKQGPYVETNDKVRFKTVHDRHIKFR
jgi:hypothetical protein